MEVTYCNHCGSTIGYDNSDIEVTGICGVDFAYYVTCPECGQPIIIGTQYTGAPYLNT